MRSTSGPSIHWGLEPLVGPRVGHHGIYNTSPVATALEVRPSHSRDPERGHGIGADRGRAAVAPGQAWTEANSPAKHRVLASGSRLLDDRERVSHEEDTTARRPSDTATLAGDEGDEGSDESLEGRHLRANVESRLFAGRVTPIRVGRFEIKELLGRGGMGVVYRAHDPQLDRDVAIKVLDSRGMVSATRRSRMLLEAQAMAKLNHPHVVAVHEAGEIDEGVFIAMELVEGVTLSTWVAEQPRSWRDVRDVFLAAGRGLAAAHAVGVLHRDFKPDNVMIGRDGRVRVMDFGLAHVGLASESSSDSAHETTEEPALSLTNPGEALGTPAYMAPEQFRGIADARSDQFSFCVAMFEALFGTRPFVGSTIADLMWATANGEIRVPRRRPKIPSWLHRAVRRGLAPDPDDRHVGMDALLEALAHDRVLARRRTVLAFAGIATAAAVAGLALQSNPSVCDGAASLMATAWSNDRGQALTAAFDASGLPYARRSAELAIDRLDALANRWVEVRTEVCERGVRREQSDELLDRRMSCLDEQLRRLEGSIKVLEGAEAGVIERAMDVVTDLPVPEECMKGLEAMPTTPPPALASAVEATRTLLAEADALERAGQWSRAAELADEAAARARSIEWAPLQAEALRTLGLTAVRMEEMREGSETLMEGFFVASRVERHDIAAQVSEHLVRALGNLARLDEAMTWSRHAELALDRSGAADVERARLEDAIAGALNVAGRFDDAVARQITAIEMAERALPDDDPRLALLLSNSAQALSRSGNHEEAVRRLRRAARIFEASIGPDHPKTAIAYNNLGIVLKNSAQLEEALEVNRRALEIRERALGPDSPQTLSSLTNVSITLAELGQHEEAVAMARDVVERTRARAGDPQLKARLMNLGWMLDRQGRHEEALVFFEEGLTLSIETFGADHAETAVAHHNVGASLGDLGQYARSVEHLERAVMLRRKHHGPTHDKVAHSLLILGRTKSAMGRHREAKALLEEALSIREQDGKVSPTTLAHTLTSLGEVQRAADDSKAARESFERAVAIVDANDLANKAAGRAQLALAMALDASARTRAVALARSAVELLRAEDDPRAETAAEWLKQHDR
jgi:eukaryotic-like serine/threonine-protein kinase